jgi:hypothetical protein
MRSPCISNVSPSVTVMRGSFGAGGGTGEKQEQGGDRQAHEK